MVMLSPWVRPSLDGRITVLSTLPEWRPAATGTYMQIRQKVVGP